MEQLNILEFVGFIGSVIIAISLTMSSMIKLRWLNLVGAIIFTVYGFAINALPVALVNGFITIIDIYYLVKIYTNKDFFTILRVDSDKSYIKHFIEFHEEKIDQEFPNFNKEIRSEQTSYLILRNMQTAGVFIGERQGGNCLRIVLDYAIPPFQDFKTGAHLLKDNLDLFRKDGITLIEVIPTNKALKTYYSKMGFVQDKNQGDGVYVKNIG